MRKKREKEVEAKKKKKRAKNEANTNVNVIEFGLFTRRSMDVEVWPWAPGPKEGPEQSHTSWYE